MLNASIWLSGQGPVTGVVTMHTMAEVQVLAVSVIGTLANVSTNLEMTETSAWPTQLFVPVTKRRKPFQPAQ